MLTPVKDAPAVVACNTCRFSPEETNAADGRRGGALLVDALRRARDGDPAFEGIEIQEMPCLFACKDYCTVHLRAPGKIGYVMGRFVPGDESAQAILEYAVRYSESEFGQVPYALWPEGVKGHFLTRTPPAGYVAE